MSQTTLSTTAFSSQTFIPDSPISDPTFNEEQLIWFVSTLAYIFCCVVIFVCSCLKVDLFVLYLNKYLCGLPRVIGWVLTFLAIIALLYGIETKFFFFF